MTTFELSTMRGPGSMNILIILAAMGLTAACSDSDHWRPLSSNELSEQWRDSVHNRGAAVVLDLDGDGDDETAEIVVSRDGRKSGIEVCGLSSGCVVTAVSENIAQSMGVERIPPGCYEFISTEQDDKAGRVCSVGDVLGYFKFASASSFIIADSEGRLRRFWDSD